MLAYGCHHFEWRLTVISVSNATLTIFSKHFRKKNPDCISVFLIQIYFYVVHLYIRFIHFRFYRRILLSLNPLTSNCDDTVDMATSFPWHCHQSSHFSGRCGGCGRFQNNDTKCLCFPYLYGYELLIPDLQNIAPASDLCNLWFCRYLTMIKRRTILRLLTCFNETLFVTNMRYLMWDRCALKLVYINWFDLTETTIF